MIERERERDEKSAAKIGAKSRCTHASLHNFASAGKNAKRQLYELVLLALGDITLQDRRTGGQKDGIESEEVGRRDVESKKQPKMMGRLTSGRCVGPLKAARSYRGEIFRKGWPVHWPPTLFVLAFAMIHGD